MPNLAAGWMASEKNGLGRWRTWALRLYLPLASLAFIVLALQARGAAGFPVDREITAALGRLRSPWMDAWMRGVSEMGYDPQAGILFGLLCLLLYGLSRRWEAITAAGGLITAHTLNYAMKLLVNRPRPPAEEVQAAHLLHDPAFPSGHVTTYVVFFGFLFYLCYVLLRDSWLRRGLLFGLGILIVLVGPSRIYLGEHWASDVVGGYLLGSIVLIATVFVHRWGRPRFFVHRGDG